jgi:hypothetical protein
MRAVDDPPRGGMRAGIDAHRVKGGLKPTPAMPGMDRLWGVATRVASSGDDAHGSPQRRDPAPIDPP